MFFAVFSEDAIVYLGEDPTEAALAFRLKDGVKLEYADDIIDLKNRFDSHISEQTKVETQAFEDVEERISEALENLLNKLDDMGVTENVEYCTEKMTEAGKKVIKDVRHLGHKMMRTAGENFIWLGDLLKQEADDTFCEELDEQEK